MNMVRFCRLFALLIISIPVIAHAQTNALIRDKSLDLTGYYLPTAPVQYGRYELYHISFGTPEDLTTYERKGQTIKTWAPFMMVFSDLKSPEKMGELGLYRENMPRVFCKSYQITLKKIACEGYDPQLGRVHFVGKIDPVFVRQLSNKNARPEASDSAVLSGTLSVGKYAPRKIAMSYFVGD